MKRPDIGDTRTIVLPAAWRTADWQAFEVLGTKEMPEGHTLLMTSGCLADGTNVYAVLYPGGSWLCRSGPTNGWALEEAHRGRAPWARHAADVEEIWKFTLRVVAESHEKATADEQSLPPDDLRAKHLDASLLAFTSAMRIVADGLATCDDDDEEVQQDQVERLKRGIYGCVRCGATRAQLAAAVAEAKQGRGESQRAILDAIIHMVVNELPPEPSDMGER